MEKNLKKVKDMKHAKYMKWIIGDAVTLNRIKLMYEDLNPVITENKILVSDGRFASTGEYALVFKVEISVWNKMVKNLGLKCNKDFKRKREWRIA